MIPETKVRSGPDALLDVLHFELVSGSEILVSWIDHLQAKGGIACLFEFETWLRALCAFSDYRHLPLAEVEKAALLARNFAPEIAIFRLALRECEGRAIQLCALGRDAKLGSETRHETRLYSPQGSHSRLSRILEQTTPMESLSEFLESIHDLDVLLQGCRDPQHEDFQIFLSIGHNLKRIIRNCRYIDMLISQRFRLQYDRNDNAALSAALRSIQEEHVRRNMSHALLFLYRLLNYLKPVQAAMREDLPLRRFLVIFSFLHEQTEQLCDFLRSRFLRERQGNPKLRKAAERVLHSLKVEMQRTFDRELVSLSADRDASVIYAKMENSHGLLRNCYQSSIIILVQALDHAVDAKALFPSLLEGFQQGEALRTDLWDLRHDLKSELQKSAGLDLSQVLGRIALFRESSLKYLMYQDWGEFENLSESLITAANEMEVRILLRKFVSYLEVLMQEVAKRSVLHS
jgi:hypothetical protein